MGRSSLHMYSCVLRPLLNENVFVAGIDDLGKLGYVQPISVGPPRVAGVVKTARLGVGIKCPASAPFQLSPPISGAVVNIVRRGIGLKRT